MIHVSALLVQLLLRPTPVIEQALVAVCAVEQARQRVGLACGVRAPDYLTAALGQPPRLLVNNGYTDQIKAVDSRMSDIVHLQKHIGSYSKTREIYSQYRASGYSKKFYNAHADAIKVHRAAKKYFDEQGYGKDKKLPSMKSLTQEYAALKARRGELYQDYKLAYDSMRELGTVKYNTDVILGKAPTSKNPHHNGQGDEPLNYSCSPLPVPVK